VEMVLYINAENFNDFQSFIYKNKELKTIGLYGLSFVFELILPQTLLLGSSIIFIKKNSTVKQCYLRFNCSFSFSF